jgi:hypothetical protein
VAVSIGNVTYCRRAVSDRTSLTHTVLRSFCQSIAQPSSTSTFTTSIRRKDYASVFSFPSWCKESLSS